MFGFLGNFVESFVDNVIRDKVREPDVGAIVYCDLALGYMEHSGIYIGNNKIIHLNGKGWIEIVSPYDFIRGTTAISIYTSCIDSTPIGNYSAAERAKYYEKKVGVKNYNFLLSNCHIFSSSCITGNTDNSDTFLWMLKDTSEKDIGVNSWRVWDI